MIAGDERNQRLSTVRLYGEMMVRCRIAKYGQLHLALKNQPLYVGSIVRAQLEFDLRVALFKTSQYNRWGSENYFFAECP